MARGMTQRIKAVCFGSSTAARWRGWKRGVSLARRLVSVRTVVLEGNFFVIHSGSPLWEIADLPSPFGGGIWVAPPLGRRARGIATQ